MTYEKRCPECDLLMDEGHIVDFAQNGCFASQWAPGKPKWAKFLGISLSIKVDKSKLLEIDTYRCPNCGLLKSYAHDNVES